jgi:hypothetical protein
MNMRPRRKTGQLVMPYIGAYEVSKLLSSVYIIGAAGRISGSTQQDDNRRLVAI